jgi:hypothetical protein
MKTEAACQRCGAQFSYRPRPDAPARKYCSKRCYNGSGKPEHERFMDKVAIGDEDDCWPWRGGTNEDRYGLFRARNKTVNAHRYALALSSGTSLDTKLLACHSCDNPPCCNPKHLFWSDQDGNMKDMAAKGRGSRAWYRGAKLTERDVIDVTKRFVNGDTVNEIAELYGVTKVSVRHVLRGKTFQHLTRQIFAGKLSGRYISDETRSAVVASAGGARKVAAQLGISATTVKRIRVAARLATPRSPVPASTAAEPCRAK